MKGLEFSFVLIFFPLLINLRRFFSYDPVKLRGNILILDLYFVGWDQSSVRAVVSRAYHSLLLWQDPSEHTTRELQGFLSLADGNRCYCCPCKLQVLLSLILLNGSFFCLQYFSFTHGLMSIWWNTWEKLPADLPHFLCAAFPLYNILPCELQLPRSPWTLSFIFRISLDCVWVLLPASYTGSALKAMSWGSCVGFTSFVFRDHCFLLPDIVSSKPLFIYFFCLFFFFGGFT